MTYKQMRRAQDLDRHGHAQARESRIKEQEAVEEHGKWERRRRCEHDASADQREQKEAQRSTHENRPSDRGAPPAGPRVTARAEDNMNCGNRQRNESRSRSRSYFSYSRSPSCGTRQSIYSDSRSPQRRRSILSQRNSGTEQKIAYAKTDERREVLEPKGAQIAKAPKPEEDENYLRCALADIRDRKIPQEVLTQMLGEYGLEPPVQKATSPPGNELRRKNETRVTSHSVQAKKASRSPAKEPRKSHSQEESPKRKKTKKKKEKSRSRTMNGDKSDEKERKKKKKKRTKEA